MTSNRLFRVVSFILAICGVLAQMIVPAAVVPTFGRDSRDDNKVKRPADPAISFEKNLGQYDERVIFAGKGNGQTVFLTADEATFVKPIPALKSNLPTVDEGKLAEPAEERSVYALKMKFAGANSDPDTVFEGELDGKLGYFKGNDPSKWVPEVPRYGRVTSRNVYKGIDITWYENGAGSMEYDFNIAPGADPNQVVLDFDGADRISVNGSGDLEIETPAGPMYQRKPVVYQESGGLRKTVESGYTANGSRVSFALGDYDHAKTLVIDPLPPLFYSTFVGGTNTDTAASVKADQYGNAYVTGNTLSVNYPITSGTNPADRDIFVSKLNPSGNFLLYSVLIGGSGGESGESIAIDGSGNVYVTGTTNSTNFPVSWLSCDPTFNGGTADSFILKLNTSGTVNYATYIGGSGDDRAWGIAVDSEGSAYITGSTQSSNYPTTAGAYDQTLGHTQDAFVTKINPAGLFLTYSTYLGGLGAFENGNSIAVDSLGRSYVTGSAHGGGHFPVTPGSYSTPNSTTLPDCFVTKFNSAGSAVVYSSIFGGDHQDDAKSIAIDSSGNAYITGNTMSSNYPKTIFAYDTVYNSSLVAAFVTKLNSTGSSLGYSTLLEGNDGLTKGNSIFADNSGKVTLVGVTSSASFPAGPMAFDVTYNGQQDAFLVKMPTTAFSTLITSTFLGGSDYETARGVTVDNAGFALIVGETASSGYPVTPNAFDKIYNGSTDAFVTRYEADYLP